MQNQIGGGKCSLCKSDGVTKVTCPLNPKAKNGGDPSRHPNANAAKVVKVAKTTKKIKPKMKQKQTKETGIQKREVAADAVKIESLMTEPELKGALKVGPFVLVYKSNEKTVGLLGPTFPLKDELKSKFTSKKYQPRWIAPFWVFDIDHLDAIQDFLMTKANLTEKDVSVLTLEESEAIVEEAKRKASLRAAEFSGITGRSTRISNSIKSYDELMRFLEINDPRLMISGLDTAEIKKLIYEVLEIHDETEIALRERLDTLAGEELLKAEALFLMEVLAGKLCRCIAKVDGTERFKLVTCVNSIFSGRGIKLTNFRCSDDGNLLLPNEKDGSVLIFKRA